MKPFNYHQPQTVADAVAALKAADDGKLLAGGQSFLPVLKLELAAPSDLVSLSAIDELRGIRKDGDNILIGALTTHAEVEHSDVVKADLPALAALAARIGDAQVRNRGTLGGSIAHADPAADYPAAVLALKGQVKTDRRQIAADDFFTGLFETALADDEIVTSVSFAVPKRAAYAKFPHPASRFAVVGVMVAQYDDGVRVAVTGAAAAAFRASDMEAALAASFSPDALANVSVAAGDLQTDIDFSAEYRAHLVGVMARRAVAACA